MTRFNRGDTVKVVYINGFLAPEGTFGDIVEVLVDEIPQNGVKYSIDLFLPDFDFGLRTTINEDHLLPFGNIEVAVPELPTPYDFQDLPPKLAYLRMLERMQKGIYAIQMNHWKSYRTVVSPRRLNEVKKAYDDYVQNLQDMFRDDLYAAFYRFFRGNRSLYEEVYAYIKRFAADFDATIEEMYNFVNVFFGYYVAADAAHIRDEALKSQIQSVKQAQTRVDQAWRRWESAGDSDTYRAVSDDLFGAYAYFVSQQQLLIRTLTGENNAN